MNVHDPAASNTEQISLILVAAVSSGGQRTPQSNFIEDGYYLVREKEKLMSCNFHKLPVLALVLISLLICGSYVSAQSNAFTYQGKLTDTGTPANGTYQIQFALFDAPVNGNQIGSTITNASVQVAGGVFTVDLDFGPAAFPGAQRYLQLSVFSSTTNAFVTLIPRQQLSSAPYAIRALASDTATLADNSTRLGGLPDSEYVQTNNPALTDARDPLPGSANYVQNTTTQQTSANFNIDGTGTADILNAKTQLNINGNRFLSPGGLGTNNLFLGFSVGVSSSGGTSNSVVGTNAGTSLTNGSGNSFFGQASGFATMAGSQNSFFGWTAGANNLTGNSNSFIGSGSGLNSNGSNNTFLGTATGQTNETGSNNTLVGAGANVTSINLTNAAAFGAGATVSSSNMMVLGRSAGQDSVLIPGNLTITGTLNSSLPAGSPNYIQNGVAPQASSNFNISGNGTAGGTLSGNIVNAGTQFNLNNSPFISAPIGTNFFAGVNAGLSNVSGGFNTFVGASAGRSTVSSQQNSFFGADAGKMNTAAFNSFFGSSAGSSNTSGSSNSFFGQSAGLVNVTGGGNSYFGTHAGDSADASNNSFFGAFSGNANTSGSGNVFLGINAGSSNTTGSSNTIIGANADVGATNLTNATAIGADATVSTSNTIVLGRSGGQDKVRVPGLGSAGATALCRNANNEISTCSSSLRYKTNIASFTAGLDIVNRLRPITFDWRQDGMHDLGLGAEDVAAVSELLVIRNSGGQVEGVKYDRIGVVLLNAVKEQQAQIEELKKQIEALKKPTVSKAGKGGRK